MKQNLSDEARSNNVREWRQRLGMNQEQLAKLVGIHSASLANIENGSRAGSPDTRHALVVALGVSYETLFPIKRPARRLSGSRKAAA